ncbi:Por secretion system C-terminal sorting domain-containing protein [Siphonobacter aquaeclarae]|uniref:Por secretion system C-terminal sorting domain-containing protein n=2 Tax=Siphonobacter aquaeclarae TaxID=563176 RepID=A0A1G9I4Z7_9BACT|nr:Por secretion system C-terminal sorting domain-containing protein [Siphonobacter aquaeclarae]
MTRTYPRNAVNRDVLTPNQPSSGTYREISKRHTDMTQPNSSGRKTQSLVRLAVLVSCWLTCLLPVNVYAQAYQWKNVQIHGGGFVTGIIYSPTEQNLVYARTDIGGAYRWDAANKVWIPLSDGFASGDDYGVVSMATDPSNPNRVYMATGLYTQSWGGPGALYASTDKGATWTRNSLSIKLGGNENGRSAGERLQVDPNLGSTLFLGSSTDGLWKSTNYGAAWSKVNSFPVSTSPIGSGGISFVLFDKSSSTSGTATKTIYVGVLQTGTNLYKSTDGGATWTAVSGQPTNLMPHQAALASNGTIYLSYADASGPNNAGAGAVWKLNPANTTWTNVSPSSGQGGYGGISVDAQNSNHLIVSTLDRWWPRDEVYRSVDGGASWTALLTNAAWDHSLAPYAAGMNPHWLGDVEIDPFNAGNAWFVTGYGVYNSNNLGASPTTWIFQNKGLEETAALELISPPSGAPLLSALGDIDGFKHDNLDVSPAAGRLSPQYGTSISIDFAQSVPGFMARTYNNSGGNYGSYSTDGGSTWTSFPSVPSGTSDGGNIAVSADGNRIVWAPEGASALYYSTNRGTSWTACGSVPANLKPISDRVNSQKFYAYDAVNGRVWVSTNGGASFSIQASGLPTVPDYLAWQTRIRSVFGVEGDIWLVNPSGVYRSTNSGTSFTQLSSAANATAVSFGKAASGKTYPAVFIAGTVNGTYGIYRSDDAGAAWTRINDAQHQYGTITVMTGDPRVYGRVYFGGTGRGILYGDIPNASSLVSGATYRIVARHSNQLLDVVSASTADGAQVDQWPGNSGSNQQWVATGVGSGYYTFKAVHSSKNLDINGFSSADGAKVQQWTAGTGTNQQFELVDRGGGYYQIKARHSGKCLDVADASTTNGALVQQATCSNGTNQQFRFELVSTAAASLVSGRSAEEAGSVMVHPNPSSRVFQVKAPSDFTYEIYDLAGRRQESGKGEDGSNVGRTLKPGLYVLKVQTGTTSKVVRVVKQ